MQIIWFAGLVVCIYFCTLFGFLSWIKKQTQKTLTYRLRVGVGAFLMGAFMLGLAGSNIICGAPNLRVYTWMIGVLFGLLYLAARFCHIKAKIVWVPLMCLVGTYVLHKAIPVIPMTPMNVMAMFASWTTIMSLVMFFDRLPLLNFLTLGAWTLAFAVMSCLNMNAVPPQIAAISLLLMAPLWGVISVLSRRGDGSLGTYGSTFLGFIMGGIVAICTGAGSYGSALALSAYYLFELGFFIVALIGLHPMGMEKGSFAFGTILMRGDPVPVVKVVFFRLIILSLLASMMWRTNRLGILTVIIMLIMLDLYNRFKVAGAPAPTIKEMWCDTKEGLKKLWKQERGPKTKEVAVAVERKPVKSQKAPAKKQKVSVKKTTKKTKKVTKGKKKK